MNKLSAKILRRAFPQLDSICWHVGGSDWVTRQEAFALYEANWAYVDVHALTAEEKDLLIDLSKHEGGGLFCPKGGQPIDLEGVHCV